MGRFTKRLRAAFGRRQVRAAPPAQVPGGYVDRHPYVDCLVAAASRVPQADAEVDRAVKAIAEGDLAALQSACETLAQLGAEIGEHAVEATKLVRAERIRQIDQPERAA